MTSINCAAMYRLRHILSWRRTSSRAALIVFCTVRLSRALFSGAVIVDTEAPAGNAGLVVCSIHGPVFRRGGHARTDRLMWGGMSMSVKGMRSLKDALTMNE